MRRKWKRRLTRRDKRKRWKEDNCEGGAGRRVLRGRE